MQNSIACPFCHLSQLPLVAINKLLTGVWFFASRTTSIDCKAAPEHDATSLGLYSSALSIYFLLWWIKNSILHQTTEHPGMFVCLWDQEQTQVELQGANFGALWPLFAEDNDTCVLVASKSWQTCLTVLVFFQTLAKRPLFPLQLFALMILGPALPRPHWQPRCV